jgi:hypothetical protein
MTASTKIQWRVQVRKSRTHVWKNKGLFETRRRARDQAVYLRDGIMRCGETLTGTAYGFGNTRVVRYVKGAK